MDLAAANRRRLEEGFSNEMILHSATVAAAAPADVPVLLRSTQTRMLHEMELVEHAPVLLLVSIASSLLASRLQ
jgi:hypothetical protein